MDRKTQRRGARLARLGTERIHRNQMVGYLWRAAEAKPGWAARNWIMNQEWFDYCLEYDTGVNGKPGFLLGLPIGVDDVNAGFPRIERYIRQPPPDPPRLAEWERSLIEKQARKHARRRQARRLAASRARSKTAASPAGPSPP